MQTKKPDLTNKIKHFIEEYYGQHGTSPSIRCIAENVGCSKSNVTIYIDYLKEQGLLEIGEDGYVRLPASFVGNAKKCFLLTACGNSMIDAGIHDGDLVLVRQQETANYNDIVVALVDNEVTLKRYRPDLANRRIILHPENKRMKDIVVEECKIQGIATKVIKNLES